MLPAADLAAHYSRFRVADRLLLTGHSHQAWPDIAFEAQQRAWLDAAELVDGKWERAEEQAAQVCAGFARLLGDTAENIALGQSTHELVTRWLSALPLAARPRIVTTGGEFHTIRRLVDRLAEEGVEVVTVATQPVETLAERLAMAVDDRTACVLVSSVLYETAEIVPNLVAVATACARHGAELLIDAYHHLNVVPFDIDSLGVSSAFITGGGYKYCQLGEGNCFLRVPEGRDLRPVLTGWFAEFSAVELRGEGRVRYAPGAAAFAGATYDPTSNYRAAAVFRFHADQHLTAAALRETSKRQVGILQSQFERLAIDPERARIEPIDASRRAGFLAIRMADAAAIAQQLRARNVLVDARGERLRLGPAPYLRDDQLREAVAQLGGLLCAAP